MTEPKGRRPGRTSALAPLREPTYRRIWSASVIANFGQLILGVGAAWEMTRLGTSAEMVALVQTALMLPIMLIAVPAGAIADMFDRRTIAMVGLGFATAAGALLTVFSVAGLATPWLLLGFCSLIGIGVALYAPAWAASVSEQVKSQDLPAAIALSSISYNVARSFGPAVGGVIVLAAGAQAAFAINAVAYLPLLAAFFLWQRNHVPPRLPPERIDRAIVGGARYARHSAPVRTALARAFAYGLAGATVSALAPLVARDLLHGDASTFGLLLGCVGIGAVAGALGVSHVRARFRAEQAVRMCALIGGAAIIGIGSSDNLLLSALLMAITGGVNMLTVSLLNVTVQLSVPRWVTARALSLFQSAITGGFAIGAWLWGAVAVDWGVANAFYASGAVLMLTALLGLLLPMPDVQDGSIAQIAMRSEPDVALALTARSGPIVIEMEYCVDPADARSFYELMLKLQRVRLRNGGYGWSLSRDIADPEIWTERYQFPTWEDYLRHRDRFTEPDLALQAAADAFNKPADRRVRRKLERPFGSVRWRPESPDPKRATTDIFTP